MAQRTPPLRDIHTERGATFTEFGGWEMPVEFDSIRTEHESVRKSVGIFDVSHMGEIEVQGPDAAELTQRLTTNNVEQLAPGHGQYAAITDERGVILDDTLIYNHPETAGYLFIPNAGHDEEMFDRWRDHRDEWGLECEIENATEQYAMFAVQGPEAVDHVAKAADPGRIRSMDRFEIGAVTVAGIDCLAARTGYTGEDGFELLLPWDSAQTVWNAFDCQHCGLGARDTLRIEQGFLLSGQDFHPEENPRTPFEAGIGFVVALDTEFVGRDHLAESDPDVAFVGFELTERGVPRHGYEITDDGDRIGTVTSGTMSPTLEKPIGLGYVSTEYTEPDTEIRVVIRGQEKTARIKTPPFEQ